MKDQDQIVLANQDIMKIKILNVLNAIINVNLAQMRKVVNLANKIQIEKVNIVIASLDISNQKIIYV